MGVSGQRATKPPRSDRRRSGAHGKRDRLSPPCHNPAYGCRRGLHGDRALPHAPFPPTAPSRYHRCSAGGRSPAMAKDEKDSARIKQGVAVWNDWRTQNPQSSPWTSARGEPTRWGDPLGRTLARRSFPGARPQRIRSVSLAAANLTGANLSGAKLSRANLSGANLRSVSLGRGGPTRGEPRRGGPHLGCLDLDEPGGRGF